MKIEINEYASDTIQGLAVIMLLGFIVFTMKSCFVEKTKAEAACKQKTEATPPPK